MSEPVVSALLSVLRPELEKLVRQLVSERLVSFVPAQPDPWLTVTEASSYMKLTPPALRARIRRGTLPAYRDGHRWLFHRDELDDHIRRADQNGRYPAADNSINGPARLHPPGPWLQGGTP